MINKEKIKKIVEALELKEGDTIIEIGPGHGELTRLLAAKLKIKNKKSKIIAIEKDKNLAEILRNRVATREAARGTIRDREVTREAMVEIIEGDALRILPKIVESILRTSDVLRLKIVGNIPYYITGKLLRILGELEYKPSLIVLTIQREVAQRVCAQPPKMNLLAASVQFWAEPKIVGYISKRDFRPMPKVDSAIIKLTPKNQNLTPEIYYKLIKILFKQPRKTIFNNLKPITKNPELITKKLKSLGINPSDRPQNLSLEQIIELSTLF